VGESLGPNLSSISLGSQLDAILRPQPEDLCIRCSTVQFLQKLALQILVIQNVLYKELNSLNRILDFPILLHEILLRRVV
jgi:hypothetical protein